MSSTLQKAKIFQSFFLALLLLGVPGASLQGQDEEPPPEEAAAQEEPDWNLELGLSYLATSGNSETSSGGFKAAFAKEWDPWSLEANAFFLHAEDDGETTVEHSGASVTAGRDLTECLSITAGLSGEQDRFSGIDFRTVLSAGVKWKMIKSERWTLDSRAALTWTSEEFDGTQPSNDYLGALAGLASKWKISAGADLSAKAVYFPNFDNSEDYRFEGDLALTTKISAAWALALGYQVRYDNQPAAGFERTDTATTASLVLKLPAVKPE